VKNLLKTFQLAQERKIRDAIRRLQRMKASLRSARRTSKHKTRDVAKLKKKKKRRNEKSVRKVSFRSWNHIRYAIYDTYTTVPTFSRGFSIRLGCRNTFVLAESRSARRGIRSKTPQDQCRASFTIGQDPPVAFRLTNSNEYRRNENAISAHSRRSQRYVFPDILLSFFLHFRQGSIRAHPLHEFISHGTFPP